MITLIDSTGQEVNPTPYKERLIVPADKQEEIRQWVQRAEQKIKEGLPAEFPKIADEFLHRFTYTQNILDESYQPSVESLAAITPFATASLSSGDLAESVNKQMYRLEKVARVGIEYHCHSQPELETKIKTTFTIDLLKHGVRLDALSSVFSIADIGELVKNAYLLKLKQKCHLEYVKTEEPRRNQLEGIVYQQTMGSGVVVVVQHNNERDFMRLNIVLDALSPVAEKVINTTHGFLERLAISKVQD